MTALEMAVNKLQHDPRSASLQIVAGAFGGKMDFHKKKEDEEKMEVKKLLGGPRL